MTEEIDLDLEELEKGASKSKPPSSKKNKAKPTRPPSNPVDLPTSSPFELSEEDAPPPPSEEDNALEDSSSDFELSLDGSDVNADSSSDEDLKLNLDDEEVGLGEHSAAAGSSGINLEEPADSGISLEADGSDEMEFELSLDDGTSGSTPKPKSSKSASPPEESNEFELSLEDSSETENPPADSDSEFELSLDDSDAEAPAGDSDSEFELTLDDSGSSDLALEETDSASDSEFELTLDEEGGLAPVEDSGELAAEDNNLFESDFDVPSLDDESASEAVPLEESSSDFDLAVDDSVVLETGDSQSQVVPLPEDEVDESGETQQRPARKSKLAPSGDLENEGLDLGLDESSEAAAEEEAVGEEDEEAAPAMAGGPTQYVEAPRPSGAWGRL